VTGDAYPAPNGDGAPSILASKLRPALAQRREVPGRLARLLEPRPGGLVLVHAAAGYGKTTALASTQRGSWLWYSLDGGDGPAPTLAHRLCMALGFPPSPPDLPTNGQAAAREVAPRLEGRGLTITLDRFEHVGDAGEVGRFLLELLELVPDLALRVATRTRPALALERLRLEGRLVDVGPAELRLERREIGSLLGQTLGRSPQRTELDFADQVLGGWPAALRLWRPALDGDDVAALVRPLHPLHDYLHEEVFTDTVAREILDLVRDGPAWLLEPEGSLIRDATTAEREVAERLVRDRVGVIPEDGGWRLHPLVSAFLRMSTRTRHSVQRTIGRPDRPPGPAGGAARVVVRALGSLAVTVDGVPVEDASWPTAARRLFELLLSLPGSHATAQEAAAQLWPRHLPRSALNSFNVALHGLRRVLQPEMRAGGESRYVVRQGRLYRLALDEIACDADDFSRLVARTSQPLDDDAAQRLETAVALYHGDFLATSSEGFAEQRRARLHHLWLEALERLGEWHGLAGRDGQALHAFNRMLEQSPQREDVWARVLELHLSVGDEYGALAALQRCEQSLAAAGIEPSGLLRELHRRVRRNTPPPLDPADV
jgi:two-component SAPR family response regulator